MFSPTKAIRWKCQNFSVFTFSQDLQFLPPPEKGSTRSSSLGQSQSSSRSSSTSSSHGSQITAKKSTILPKKKEDKSATSKSKETKKQLPVANYLPKKRYRAMLKFVLNESRFFGELQSRCANLCTLAKSEQSNALKATAKEPKVGFLSITT